MSMWKWEKIQKMLLSYLQHNNHNTEVNLKESEVGDYDDDLLNISENYNDPAFFLQVITSLRRFSLDRKSHIKEYYKIRKIHSEIINTMVRYHEADRFKLKIDECYMTCI